MRIEGGPVGPCDHRKVHINGLATNWAEVNRCMGDIHGNEDPKVVRREIVSLRKKLGYIGDHVNGLLDPGDECGDSCDYATGFFGELWKQFREVLGSYQEGVSELIRLYEAEN